MAATRAATFELRTEQRRVHGVSVGWGSAGAASRCNAGACNSVSHDVKRWTKSRHERTTPRTSTCRASVRRRQAPVRPRRFRRLRRAFRIDARLHAVATLGQLPSCDASDGAVRGTPRGRKAPAARRKKPTRGPWTKCCAGAGSRIGQPPQARPQSPTNTRV